MSITINTTSIQPSMVKMTNKNQFEDGDRLFYELGYYKDDYNWVRTGRFKEVENPNEFMKKDFYVSDLAYLEHHNFMIIKKKINHGKETKHNTNGFSNTES